MPGANKTTEKTVTTPYTESIQLIFDLTSRIDERVNMLIEKQKKIEEQIEKALEIQQTIINRLSILESKDLHHIQDDFHKLSEKVAVIVNENTYEDIVDLRNRTQSVEVKLENINMRVGHHDNRWGQIFDAVWKVALMCIAGYILFKLGIQAPPN